MKKKISLTTKILIGLFLVIFYKDKLLKFVNSIYFPEYLNKYNLLCDIKKYILNYKVFSIVLENVFQNQFKYFYNSNCYIYFNISFVNSSVVAFPPKSPVKFSPFSKTFTKAFSILAAASCSPKYLSIITED